MIYFVLLLIEWNNAYSLLYCFNLQEIFILWVAVETQPEHSGDVTSV
jgi:hypothetical protein